MNFDVPRRFRLGSAVPAAIAAAFTALACGGSTASTDSQAQSALSADTSQSSDDAAKLTGCLTSYVECVRGGSDGKTCHEAFHACAGPGKGRHHGKRGDGDGDGDRGGCDGDADGGRPAPPPPPSGSAAPPPPPPDGDARPDDDGDRPPPPEGAADGKGGPRACFDALDTCAKGTDAVETCVSAAVACFQALPKPPHGDHDRRPPPDGNGAPPPPAPSGSAAPAN